MEGEKEMRIDREEYYANILEAVRKRSTCDRGESGAIIVKNNRLITTGYVGAPRGRPHCDEKGHFMVHNHCIRTVHAELNAILQAARFGISIEGGTMYCTMTPCYECAKAIVNVGLVKVIATYPYPYGVADLSIQLFRDSNIEFKLLNETFLY